MSQGVHLDGEPMNPLSFLGFTMPFSLDSCFPYLLHQYHPALNLSRRYQSAHSEKGITNPCIESVTSTGLTRGETHSLSVFSIMSPVILAI